MAHLFLYDHGSLHQGGGYQIVASSATGEVYRGMVPHLQRCIRDLAFEVRLVPAEGGAVWLRLPTGSRVFGKVSVRQAHSGERFLALRMILLQGEDVAAFATNPFCLEQLINDDVAWQPTADGMLAPLDLPATGDRPITSSPTAADLLRGFSILQWELFHDQVKDILKNGMPQLTAAEQATFWFAYPLARPSRGCGANSTADGVQWVAGDGLNTIPARQRRRRRLCRRTVGIAGGMLLLALLGSAYLGMYRTDQRWQVQSAGMHDEWQQTELAFAQQLRRANEHIDELQRWQESVAAAIQQVGGVPGSAAGEISRWIVDLDAQRLKLQAEINSLNSQLQQWKDVAGRSAPDGLESRLRDLERNADAQLKAETRALEQQITTLRNQAQSVALSIEELKSQLLGHVDQLNAIQLNLVSENAPTPEDLP